ncbi:MAG: TnsA endonuclease N-terminal domain-containing protein [Verrucomicrobia bacterium]|nr:TnsA endonuclease N-terminal domain-containing protein [Verrucomicrobiota bacterium]
MRLTEKCAIRMSVRKIPVSRRTITGRHALQRLKVSVPFESLLERDFLQLMDFDRDVTAVEGQPVCVTWKDASGKARRYTPDFLVTFRPKRQLWPSRQPGKAKPWLVEVKPREEVWKNFARYRPAFRAATEYARRNGWLFHILDESRIRSGRLENARVLLPFMMKSSDSDRCRALLTVLERFEDGLTAEQLLVATCSDRINQALLIPNLWNLVGWRNIETDLSQPLTMKSRLRLPPYMASLFERLPQQTH